MQPHDDRPVESPGPRSVDQIEYPFSHTSTSENYDQVNEVVVESSVAKNQLQSATPGLKTDSRLHDTDQCMLLNKPSINCSH